MSRSWRPPSFRRSSSAPSVPRRGRSSRSPQEPDSQAAIGLGSNLGDRRSHLRWAVDRLQALGRVMAISSLWQTAPIGGVPQDDYLNAVVVIDTVRGPRPLLTAFSRIESDRGRERRQRWGPRTLDLDLLLYGDAVIEASGLQVPHPRMAERRFVLEPLAEAWPEAVLPGRGEVRDLLRAVGDQMAERIAEEWAP